MRLVIVESPFAPRTPLLVLACVHGMPCVEAKKIYATSDCFNCGQLARNKNIREAELRHNITYARTALADCLRRGEAPYASHLLYTQQGVLDDTKADERQLGITAGFAWRAVSAATVVYKDLGISQGMQLGIDHANKNGHVVEFRTLPGWAQ